MKQKIYKKIYLAGGCFWGVQGFFDLLDGVIESSVGYANSIITNPSYEEVCSGKTQAVEAIEIIYDDEIISLGLSSVSNKIISLSDLSECILSRFLSIIDPFAFNRQGNDVGTQYRSGIYCIDSHSLQVANTFIEMINRIYGKNVAIEVMSLQNFYPAENYHQKYLQKNPFGYCHIDIDKARKPLVFTKNPTQKI